MTCMDVLYRARERTTARMKLGWQRLQEEDELRKMNSHTASELQHLEIKNETSPTLAAYAGATLLLDLDLDGGGDNNNSDESSKRASAPYISPNIATGQV